MSERFESHFHSLCQMLADKPSAQVAKLGQPTTVAQFPTHHAVWYEGIKAQFWWSNGVVSSLSVPTGGPRGGAVAGLAPEDFDYRGVRIGMSKEQVESAWGAPSSGGEYLWTYEHKLPYINHDARAYKADLALGFDDTRTVSTFVATLDGSPDTEFRRLMQRGWYCLSVDNFDEALDTASQAELLLDGGGGGDYIEGQLVTPSWIRARAEQGIDARSSRSAAHTKSGGCFVATAAYGPSDQSVLLLREYRDLMLQASKPGRLFIALYLRLSPPLAGLIERSKRRRRIARQLLAPVVGFAAWRLKSRTPET